MDAMKNLGLFVAVLMCSVTLLHGQEKNKTKDPDEQIIVNKKYDDAGNLIQFDSTYVHKWSSDSTFHFSFPDNDFFFGKGFPGTEEFLHGFMNDSALGGINVPGFFHFSPFEDDEFFMPFRYNLPDSLMENFSFKMDSSLFYFPFDTLGTFQHGLVFPDLDQFHKQLNEQFGQMPNYNLNVPQFKNEKQKEEWDKLIKKHQKELEELQKKWEQKDKTKK